MTMQNVVKNKKRKAQLGEHRPIIPPSISPPEAMLGRNMYACSRTKG